MHMLATEFSQGLAKYLNGFHIVQHDLDSSRDSSAVVFGAEFLHRSGIPRSIAHEHIAASSEDSALLQTVAFIFIDYRFF